MKYAITIAAEITVEVEAESREAAIRSLRRIKAADLWKPLDLAKAEQGEPAEGFHDARVRIIGNPA